MSPLHTAKSIAIASAFALIATHALAQTDAEHTQHHPQASTSQAAPTPAKRAAPPAVEKGTMAEMDSRMKAMREMHDKMMASKTPEERNALMADHMKVMQDGMAMMGKMNGMASMEGKSQGMACDHQMMEKRMDMMTTMMQMMMDRLPAPANQ